MLKPHALAALGLAALTIPCVAAPARPRKANPPPLRAVLPAALWASFGPRGRQQRTVPAWSVGITEEWRSHMLRLLRSTTRFQREGLKSVADCTVTIATGRGAWRKYAYLSDTGFLGSGTDWCVVPDEFRRWMQEQIRLEVLPYKDPEAAGREIPFPWLLRAGSPAQIKRYMASKVMGATVSPKRLAGMDILCVNTAIGSGISHPAPQAVYIHQGGAWLLAYRVYSEWCDFQMAGPDHLQARCGVVADLTIRKLRAGAAELSALPHDRYWRALPAPAGGRRAASGYSESRAVR